MDTILPRKQARTRDIKPFRSASLLYHLPPSEIYPIFHWTHLPPLVVHMGLTTKSGCTMGRGVERDCQLPVSDPLTEMARQQDTACASVLQACIENDASLSALITYAHDRRGVQDTSPVPTPVLQR